MILKSSTHYSTLIVVVKILHRLRKRDWNEKSNDVEKIFLNAT